MGTSSDRAFHRLRADILSGRYQPGHRLGEVELAGELGTSRTPVREALHRLAADGLVELSANRGARVVAHTAADLDTVFVLRAHAEGVAARSVALTASPQDVAELGRLACAVAAAARPGGDAVADLDAVYRFNREFHELLLTLAGSASLSSVVGGLVHSTVLMRTYRAFDEGAMHRSVEHHLELVAAVQSGDPDWAESVMRSHLFSARSALLGPRRTATEHSLPQLRHEPPTGLPSGDGDLTAQESA
jgi:DNA-binding GntR family transcriptional regulator